MNDTFGRRATVSILSTLVLLSLLACTPLKSDSPATPKAPSRYGASEARGFEYYRRFGVVTRTPADAERVLGHRPPRIAETLGRARIGAVAIVAPGGGGRHHDAWFCEFYDGFEFIERTLDSTETARTLISNALAEEESELLKPGEGLNRQVGVRGHVGFACNKVTGQEQELLDGTTVLMTNSASKVAWSEGRHVYIVTSDEGIGYQELLRVARSMSSQD